MVSLHLQLKGHEANRQRYQPLLPDETISSWVERTPGVELRSNSTGGERTFGEITFDLPDADELLLRSLVSAAAPPDPWLLKPHQRTLLCLHCQAKDWMDGMPIYPRRAWSVAWRTSCPHHGRLFDTFRNDTPAWPSVLLEPLWSREHVLLINKSAFHPILDFSLYGDRRAIYLESALAEGQASAVWFPRGITEKQLRYVYQAIVVDLLSQFHFDTNGPEDEHPSSGFNRSLNLTRFSINVLAEAIISEWTRTPLPGSALSRRTSLLVRAIGWCVTSSVRPHPDKVLIGISTRRDMDLSRYFQLLPKTTFTEVFGDSNAKPSNERFTFSECRCLGIDTTNEIEWLIERTREGDFLAFDPQSGILTRNPWPPNPQGPPSVPAELRHLFVPAWVGAPTVQRNRMPPTLVGTDYLQLNRCIRRRKLRHTVRFDPLSINDTASILLAVQRLRKIFGDFGVSVLLSTGRLPK